MKWYERLKYGKQAGFEAFRRQNCHVEGKTGIILAEVGMPEDYDFGFYDRYMQHVFHYALPFFIRPIVLADRGIALIDPENPLAREVFWPAQLIDAHGSLVNRSGIPYVNCKTQWQKPGARHNPWDHGYFLYREEGKGGAPEISQKTGAKVKGWYFDRLLPQKKVPWAYQHRLIYEESAARLKEQFPGIAVVQAHYTFRESLQDAVDSLLRQNCRTIVYQCYSNPVYSDFEDYATTMPLLQSLVGQRANLALADQIGNQPHLAQGFARRFADLLAEIPAEASVAVVLSTHGHPFRKETMDQRAHLYRQPVEAAIRAVLATRTARRAVIWCQDEYAEAGGAGQSRRQSTSRAFEDAIEQGFDYAIELPTEFFGESTDTMILHAMKKYHVFGDFNRYQPVHYPDWNQPFVRRFKQGKTNAIYGGCLVGPYRKYVVDAVTASVGQVLQGVYS